MFKKIISINLIEKGMQQPIIIKAYEQYTFSLDFSLVKIQQPLTFMQYTHVCEKCENSQI